MALSKRSNLNLVKSAETSIYVRNREGNELWNCIMKVQSAKFGQWEITGNLVSSDLSKGREGNVDSLQIERDLKDINFLKNSIADSVMYRQHAWIARF